MSALQLFGYEGQHVRAIVLNGEPWFLAGDVCPLVGLANVGQALASLDDDEKGSIIISDGTPGNPNKSIVNEAGLYSLILRSRKPEAKAFKRWITHEVLPSIRQSGGYAAPPAVHQLPQSFADALRQLADTHEQLEAVAPKAEAYDALMDTSGLLSMQAAAKALGYGPNVLYRELRRMGVLQGNNLPMQRYAQHFDVKLGSYRRRNGELVPTATTMVRPAGLDFLRRKLARTAEDIAATAQQLATSSN